MQTQKQIRILENRLEKMYHKYNESKSHNQVLRTGIDNLRRERLVFDDIHRKLAKSLLVKKKEMGGVIAHTNQILESRDKVRQLYTLFKLHECLNPEPCGVLRNPLSSCV